MALQLTARENLDDVLSTFGVTARVDDDNTLAESAAETSVVDRYIEYASAEVAGKLSRRYAEAEYAGASPPTNTPTQVKWMAAIKAACFLMLRRGNAPTAALAEACEDVNKTLDDIIDGRANLYGAADAFDTEPFVTNVAIDASWIRSQIRRVQSTSTGGHPPGTVKSNPERNHYLN